MKRTVSAMEARRSFGELLEQVLHRGDEVVIERAGKPMGVLISPARYAQIEADRARAWQQVMEIVQNAGGAAGPEDDELTDDEAMEIAVAEVRAHRAELRSAER